MKNKKKQDNIYLKVIIAVIIFIISIILVIKSTNGVQDILVSYNTDSNIDYKVYIYSNDYIKSDYMEKGKTYISDLVDKIAINYNYKLTSSKELASDYKYDIVAKIVVKHNSTGKELWNEEIKLIDGKSIDKVNNTLSINDNVDVAFKQFNNKVKNFKLQFNIPIIAYMDVNLKIKDAKTNSELSSTGLSMDLNSDTFEIKEKETGKNVKNITKNENPNKTLIYIESAVAGISLLYIIYIIYRSVESVVVRKSYYSKAIYKILKNYGDIVAEIVKPVDLDNLKVIDVKNFDQMLDIEEELRIPIMFYETIKNEEGCFVLIHNDMAYRYILRDKMKY